MSEDFSWLDDLIEEANLANQNKKKQQVDIQVTLLTFADSDKHQVIFHGYDENDNLKELIFDVDCTIHKSVFASLNTLAAALEMDKQLKKGKDN